VRDGGGVRTIIGLDCAVGDGDRGIALAGRNTSSWTLREVVAGAEAKYTVGIAAAWIREASGPVLIAMDAPLGWPAPMGRQLSAHRAGDELGHPRDELFCRMTDRFVRKRLVQRHSRFKPLEVGANLIARTAHWTLSFLAELRGATAQDIPLAWRSGLTQTSAIEVYPAATALAHGLRIVGKNAKDHKERKAARTAIVRYLSHALWVGQHGDRLIKNGHALDSALCVLAGIDFLHGDAVPPVEEDLARKEGWIWFKQSDAT
jgi:hypothetical protein